MHILLEVSILVCPIFVAYALRIHGITARFGELLAEEQAGLRAKQIQRLITPPGQVGSLVLGVFLGALILALGLHLFAWYWAVLALLASCLLIPLMNYLIPSERTRHYLAVVLKHLRTKAEKCESEDDAEQAQAIIDLSKRIESIAARKNLFDEKATGY